MAKTKEATVADLISDDKNFNKGNEYGESLIEKSFQKFGAGRSVLIDKSNRIIAGNKPIKMIALNGETIKVFKSVSIAATETAIKQSAISNALTNRAKTSGGYKWEYVQVI